MHAAILFIFPANDSARTQRGKQSRSILGDWPAARLDKFAGPLQLLPIIIYILL
jgi:hypothetical protein